MTTLINIPQPPREAVSENLLFSEEHHALRRSIRAFVEKELLPASASWEDNFYPNEAVRRMGELGYLGLDKSVEYGGQGGDYASSVILFEELSRAMSGGFLMAMSVQTDMALPPILAFGTEEQKQTWATRAIKGEIVLALAMTEATAGSDLQSTTLRAERDGDEWVLNGAKMYITNGHRADLIVLLARTDPTAGHAGFTTFLVPGDSAGLSRGKPLQKMGMHSSDTAEIIFDNVRLKDSAVLGDVGRGFHQIMWELQGERLTTAVMAIGMAQQGYEATIEWIRQRETFGAPLSTRQAVTHRMAECAIKLQVARDAVYAAAWHVQNGRYPVIEITSAKLYAARIACEVLDECIQFHGAAGYMREYRVEQLYRDARLFRIGAGSDEVQLEIIAKSIAGAS